MCATLLKGEFEQRIEELVVSQMKQAFSLRSA